jgi:phosphoribosylformylglycinamidine synthase
MGSDSEALQLLGEIHDFGYKALASLEITRIYYLTGDLTARQVERIGDSVFCDPVAEQFQVRSAEDRLNTRREWGHHQFSGRKPVASPGKRQKTGGENEIEVLYNAGVSDPSEGSILRAVSEVKSQESEVRIGRLRTPGTRNQEPGTDPRATESRPPVAVRTAKRYRFIGRLTRRQIERLAAALLYNPLVQHIARPGERIFPSVPDYRFQLVTLEILGKSPKDLIHLSRERQLALNQAEMLAIQRYYQGLGRNPTDIELETFAQTWSEHCKHKTFRGKTVLDGRIITDLFQQTIQRVTKELNKPWCLSVFKDNSGVIAFDRRHGITFKVETHNHPSALEPYGGAATGIGGVIRDCLGTGLGAKPILNTDVFCFAPPDLPRNRIPKGVLHPKRILKGVVSGVRDYGNRMGIPTASGAVYFHEDFRCNPLVYCGTLGIIPRNRLTKKILTGDWIVAMGARTGRDGIHGVTFASLELTDESEVVSSAAVQIGNPIEEKKLTDALLKARDLNLFNAVTDCGGGGLSSAIGELAESKGAVVDLDKAPLKYHGLSYTEVWISESQERQIVFVSPAKLERFLRLCRELDVEAAPVGRVTSNRKLVLRYQGHQVGELDLEFLHHGWTQQERIARTPRRHYAEPRLPARSDYTGELLGLLGSLNVASKEWIIRQYDHEVQGMSVLKPFVGRGGPSDGCVLKPLPDSDRGVVVACGLNPGFGIIDPYNMAASAIDEALRNVTACGGDPAKTALLDNFCWGSPERPGQLAGFVQAAQACYDVARGLGTPFISGKDSFYNEFVAEDGKLHPIPPTLLISAVSVIPDCRQTVTTDLKQTGSSLYVLGATHDELGGSEYYARHRAYGNRVPQVRVRTARARMKRLHRAIRLGLVSACHDISEGGLAVALAEMCFAGGIGAQLRLASLDLDKSITRDDQALFSESNSRFIVEVSPIHQARFEQVIAPFRLNPVGVASRSDRLTIYGLQGEPVISSGLEEMAATWRNGLSRLL